MVALWAHLRRTQSRPAAGSATMGAPLAGLPGRAAESNARPALPGLPSGTPGRQASHQRDEVLKDGPRRRRGRGLPQGTGRLLHAGQLITWTD